MNFKKITIVTPVYNGAIYLENTILSVINQGYSNLEYIIIDGGSTDGSVDIIRKYEKHLAYWVSEPDNGLYHAVQKGFEKSTGDIMAWINSDDMYHKGAFSMVCELFTQFSQIEWLMGIPSIYDEQGRTVMVDGFKPWCKADLYMGKYAEDSWIQQESTFWRRSLWEKAGSTLNLDLKYAADFELWLRFFRYADLYSLKSLLSGFRFRSGNQVSLDNRSAYINEVQVAISEELARLPKAYLYKLQEIQNFKTRLNSFTNRISRSVYFRRNHSRIMQYEKELFQYPQRIGFDWVTQQFQMND
jgi:glycosyltransferase involved in cell wall biosynthesis